MPADHLGRGGAGPRGLDLRHQRQPQPGHHQAGGQPGRGSGRTPGAVPAAGPEHAPVQVQCR